MTLLHNLEDEISIYARGPNRVDYTFISDKVMLLINACVYDPFNENVFLDHWLLFLDIDKKLFNSKNINSHVRQQRGVNASNATSIQTYVTKHHEQVVHHKFKEKMQEINCLTITNHDAVESLDIELGKAMKHADAACMQKYTEPFSEDILMAWKELKIYQLAIL